MVGCVRVVTNLVVGEASERFSLEKVEVWWKPSRHNTSWDAKGDTMGDATGDALALNPAEQLWV